MSNQGTESLLAFAESLREDAIASEEFRGHRKTAADLRSAANIIERLAPMDADVEVLVGEN